MKKINLLTTITILFPLLLTGCASNEPQSTLAKTENGVKSQTVRVSAPEVDAAEPAVATAPDGGVYFVWVEHGEKKQADVYIQKFSAEGKAVGEKVRVNPQAGQATAWRGDQPTIVVGADGAINIGWTARVASADKPANDIMFSVSRDGGKTFGAPVKVNDDTLPADKGMHSLAVDKSGKVYLVWLDERYLKANGHHSNLSPEFTARGFRYEKAHDEKKHTNQKPAQHGEANREVYISVSKDGGKTFSPNKKIANEACPCCKTAVAAAPDGRVYIGWRQVLEGDFRHIAVASSTDGENFTPTKIVSDDGWQIAGCPVSGASLAIGKNNALNVLWFSAGQKGQTGVYRAESTDGGSNFSPRTLVSEGGAFGTPVLTDGENTDSAIVWNTGDKLYANDLQATKEIGQGELPSAALSGHRLYVGFVKKENDKRGVWLSITNK